jgi:hypothetical protein
LFHAPAAICESGPGTDMPIRPTWEAMTDGAAMSTSMADLPVFDPAPRPAHRDVPGEILGEILFPAVGQLDRRAAHPVGDLGRLFDVLELQPVAETAADVLVVERDLFGVVSGDPGHLDLNLARDLVPGPDLDAALLDLDDGVQRLQRGVGDIGRAVLRLDHLAVADGRVHVAVIAPDAVEMVVGEAFGKDAPVILLLGGVRRGPPFISDRVERPKRAPRVVGDHGKPPVTSTTSDTPRMPAPRRRHSR